MTETRDLNPIRPLAATLEPRLRETLSHPVRREVLRVLHEGEGARGVSEIAAELVPLTFTQVNYHLRVLQRSGLVLIEESCTGPAGRHRSYRSTVDRHPDVLALLRAIEPWDVEQRRSAAARDHSARLLAMFRVPRPARTLRLGAHRNRRFGPRA